MPGVYVYLSGRDTDSALLKMYGIEKEPKNDEIRVGLGFVLAFFA
jgi:hypothetical protein